MRLDGSRILVTGANRGIGRRFVDEALRRGAAKVYAASRTLPAADHYGSPLVAPVQLDVNDPESIVNAAQRCRDVNVLVNNAGQLTFGPPLDATIDDMRADMETNYRSASGTPPPVDNSYCSAATPGASTASRSAPTAAGSPRTERMARCECGRSTSMSSPTSRETG
jgi:NAD(P)-dependent dehydrogenase (short-subunit alcohol dehydrogenase family)